jgi:hypothetical protein
MLAKIHHNYIQHRSSKNHFVREEQDVEYFLENLTAIFDAYRPIRTPQERLLTQIDKFRMWLKLEPDHYLLKQWRSLVSDYWYYTQTEHFVRENWTSEHTLMLDVKVLLAASKRRLQTVHEDYKKKFPATEEEEEEEAAITILANINFIIAADLLRIP